MSAIASTELSLEKVQEAVNAIIEVLGKPENDLHSAAFTAFNNGDYQTVKRLAATNLSDSYCRCLGYLGGALKLTPNTDTILAESARAAADFTRDKILLHLGQAIAQSLN